MASEGVQRLIVRPVFGLWMLNQLGWKEEDKGGGERLLLWEIKDVQPERVKEAVARLQSEMRGIVTPVPAFFASLSSSVSVELRYLVAEELRGAFLNVVTEPTERNFLSIDRQSPTFLTLLAPLPGLPALLSDFGYEEDKSGLYFVVQQPQVPRFEAAVLELSRLVQQLRAQTPLVECVQRMLREGQGKGRLVKESVLATIKAGEKVLEDPHDSKFHRVRLDRVWRKVGGQVEGAAELWKAMGWNVLEERKDGQGKEEKGGEGGRRQRGGGSGDRGAAVPGLRCGAPATAGEGAGQGLEGGGGPTEAAEGGSGGRRAAQGPRADGGQRCSWHGRRQLRYNYIALSLLALFLPHRLLVPCLLLLPPPLTAATVAASTLASSSSSSFPSSSSPLLRLVHRLPRLSFSSSLPFHSLSVWSLSNSFHCAPPSSSAHRSLNVCSRPWSFSHTPPYR